MANPAQIAAGLWMRIYARTLIVKDSNSNSVVYTSCDNGMMSQWVKDEVIKELESVFPDKRYTDKNVALTGTHSHSGPAGFFQYFTFMITSFGIVPETTEAFVAGIVKSIIDADKNLILGSLSLSKKRVEEANINRSPYAYQANENSLENTDHDMTQLNVKNESDDLIGVFNWFAVHPTSMNNTNKLINGDNKGIASYLIEKEFPGIVAAFASTNLGDVSPNTKGMTCQTAGQDSDEYHPVAGEPCYFETSQCPIVDSDGNVSNSTTVCYALGPGKDMFDSATIIAKKQVDVSKQLMDVDGEKITGEIKFWHTYIDMPNEEGGCKPCMGAAMAAGTTDGPGASFVHQGQTIEDSSRLYDIIRTLVFTLFSYPDMPKPDEEYLACQAPKLCLLPVGYMKLPIQWHPEIVSLQMFKFGESFQMLMVPGEFTTQAGRNMRAEMEEFSKWSVVAGLANVYSDYITTMAEYGRQEYEGGSTVYGPNTLSIYTKFLKRMLKDEVLEGSVRPPVFDSENSGVWDFVPKPEVDYLAENVQFGDLLKTVQSENTQEFTFYGANPRHNILEMLDDSFFKIEKKDEFGDFQVVKTDDDWETVLHWEHADPVVDEDLARVTEINSERDCNIITPVNQPGVYGDHLLANMFSMVGHKMDIHLSIKKLEVYAEKFGDDIDSGVTDVESVVSRIIEENTGFMHHPLFKSSDREKRSEPKRVVCDRFNKFKVVWSEESGFEVGEYRIVFQGFYKERNSNELKKYSSVNEFLIN